MLQPQDPETLARLLKAPLNPVLVQSRRGGRNEEFDYISGPTIISQANAIFGFGQWSFVHEEPQPFYDLDDKLVAYTCRGTLSVNGVTYTDDGATKVAYPSNGNKPNADHLLTARKGAITDAKRRCFRNFGAQFGNDLYNTEAFSKTVANHVIQRLVAMSYDPKRATQIVTNGYNGQLEAVPVEHALSILERAVKAHQERLAENSKDANNAGKVTDDVPANRSEAPANRQRDTQQASGPIADAVSRQSVPTAPADPAPQRQEREPVLAQQREPAPAAQQSPAPAQQRSQPNSRPQATPPARASVATGSDYMDLPDQDPFS